VERAVSLGITPEQLKAKIDMQWEMLKRMNSNK